MGQPRIPPTPAGTSMAGKTVIITGGNAGLGLEAARQFLRLQAARVIITVRSQSKGLAAVSALHADPVVKAVNPSAKVEAFLLDLDDYEAGLQFSQRVEQEVPELDVLLCNGGMNIMNYQVSKSGHEEVMQGKLQNSTSLRDKMTNICHYSQLLYSLPHCIRIAPASPSYSSQTRDSITPDVCWFGYTGSSFIGEISCRSQTDRIGSL
jgi:hypothetical protein